ncbi:ATP-binding protein [Halobacillus salinus]|uniref:ATP-binding protein n=1 Tax=Halobacillus salinus TaxID=192814 RepID=UPI0009A5E586|nr:ATP-binding protein [Halobacillus salinus]
MSELQQGFNTLSQNQIVSNIERIISSYRSSYDIFTELIQNSADALIDQHGFENLAEGFIKLEIDTTNRELIIEDNGCGIEESNLSKILINGESIKRANNKGKYGFMGYGLTFIAFQSSYISIESTFDGKKASRTYENLFKTIYEGADLPQSMEEGSISSEDVEEENGTKITLRFPTEFPVESLEENLNAAFNYPKNKSLFEHILRTRSAVGLLDPIFDDDFESFEFKFTVDQKEVVVETKYLTTREIIISDRGSRRVMDITQQFEPVVEATKDLPMKQANDARKVVLLDKIIKDVKIGSRNPLNARVYLASTSKENLNKHAKELGLSEEDDSIVSNGLYLALNGLPTGICLNTWNHSTYLPLSGVVDIIDDNSIRREMDSGRKGITDYRVKQINEEVRKLLREHNFLKYRGYVKDVDSRIGDPFYDPNDALRQILNKKQSFKHIPLKHKFFPPHEEQEIVSLFIELISRDFIKGYEVKTLSGYQVYDGLFNYSLTEEHLDGSPMQISEWVFDAQGGELKGDLLIEFKKCLKSIYKDIDQDKKDINHIKALVCWEIGDEQFYLDQGDRIIDVSENNAFHGVTSELVTTRRHRPLPIIELKEVIKILFDVDVK